MLRLNNRVQNAPLKASFDSKSLSVSPEHFIIPPGHSKLGPFALQAKQGSKPGGAKLTVVLSGLSEDAQVNIPNNPHRLDIPGVKISRRDHIIFFLLKFLRKAFFKTGDERD